MAVIVVEFDFSFISIIFKFSLMKTKQTAVRSPTGSGRPPVTGFHWNPCMHYQGVVQSSGTRKFPSWQVNFSSRSPDGQAIRQGTQ